MMVDGNKLGDVGFQYLGVPYSQMDCQAFVEKCLADCGMKIDLAGSNAWFREVHKNGWTGTPEECVATFGRVPKGAFLFILQHDGKEPAKYEPDGLGNASHIGLVTMPRGEGAIHSSASRGCVAESVFKGKTIKNGGWNMVGLWDKVAYDYGDQPEPSPEPSPEPEPMTAEVWAENGKPVNLRKRASRLSGLVDRVPCGETVEVLEYQEDWCRICWKKKTGYMMTEFLIFEDQDELVTVVIPNLTRKEAESIQEIYPNAYIAVG